jgi:putative endonuclease
MMLDDAPVNTPRTALTSRYPNRCHPELVEGRTRRDYTDVKQYWAYILECRGGSYYFGVTSNVDVRVAQHASGWDPACYTHNRRPVKLMYAQSFSTPDEAIFAEKRLKGWSRAKKRALIARDWNEVRRLSRVHGPNGPSKSSR